MKDFLIKNIHYFILIYAGWNIFTIYEEQTVNVEQREVSLEAIRARLKKSKADLEKVDQFNRDLESSKMRVNEVVKEIEKVQRQLPSDINDSEVLGIMSDIALGLKIQKPETLPRIEESFGFYYAKEYQFSAVGTFLQFLILFEKLEDLSKIGRILNVKYLSYEQDEDADSRSQFKSLVFKTMVESFRYNPSYKPKESIETPPTSSEVAE